MSRESAKLASALATLNTYLGNTSAAGVDPAFLAIQVRYLSGATSAIRDAAATLTSDALAGARPRQRLCAAVAPKSNRAEPGIRCRLQSLERIIVETRNDWGSSMSAEQTESGGSRWPWS